MPLIEAVKSDLKTWASSAKRQRWRLVLSVSLRFGVQIQANPPHGQTPSDSTIRGNESKSWRTPLTATLKQQRPRSLFRANKQACVKQAWTVCDG